MDDFNLGVPVAFLVFNRPDCTLRVFERIRQARPKKLLVVADGPRPDRSDDREKCNSVRKIIREGLDWQCEVLRNFSEENLGCGKRVFSGLDWVFSQVEEAIILEDDCLPRLTFFRFCQELLEKYRCDSRIGQICGNLRVAEEVQRNTSYFFSKYGPIWGWASWRRAWVKYDFNMASWPLAKQLHSLDGVITSKLERRWREDLYDQLFKGQIETWDFQWGFTKLSQSMLSIIPKVNLVENIGFNSGGAHNAEMCGAANKSHEISFPLIHPTFVLPDAEFDREFSSNFSPTLMRRICSKGRALIGRSSNK